MVTKRGTDENSGPFTTMEYYPGLQFNELEWHESPWINLRNLMLSEKGKWQTSTYMRNILLEWIQPDVKVFLKMCKKRKYQNQDSGYPLSNGIRGTQ